MQHVDLTVPARRPSGIVGLADVSSGPSGWRSVLGVVAAAAAVLWLASVAQDAYALRTGAWDPANRIWLLDVDFEQGLFTWMSVLSLYTAGVILLLIGASPAHGTLRERGPWLLLGFMFLALSADDHVGIHEKLSALLSRTTGGGSGLFYFAWAAPAGLLCLAGLLWFLPFLSRLPRRVFALMLLSAALFLGGAVGLEMVAGAAAEASGVFSAPYRIVTNIEEACELFGVLLFIHALLLFVEMSGGEPVR